MQKLNVKSTKLLLLKKGVISIPFRFAKQMLLIIT